MRTLNALLVTATCVILAGCSSSPVSSGRKKISGTQMLAIGGGTALGGVAGASLDKKNPTRGAAIGAGITGLVTGISTAIYNNNQGQREAEIREQAARDERVKIMNKDWYNKTQSYVPDSTESEQTPKETVTDEAGTYQGVPYFKQERVVGEKKDSSVFERPRS